MANIKIKRGSGIPSGLTFGELAFDTTNRKLYVGLTAGAELLTSPQGGVSSIRGLTGAVGLTNGSGIGLSVSGNTLTVLNTGVLSIDGGTGAITNVARTNVNNYFTTQQFVQGNIVSTSASNFGSITIDPTNQNLTFYEDTFGNQLVLSALSNHGNQTIEFPLGTTRLAGLAENQTFTNTNTFTELTRFNTGISSAGGTFSALTRFNTGISSAGGTFSALTRFTAGISSAGATLSSNTNIPAGSTLTVNGNFVANGNVNLGDATSDSITVAGLLTANAGVSAAGGTFSALTRFTAGISAAGGITFNSNVSVNSANTLNVSRISGTTQLDIDNRPSARVAIGDFDGVGQGTSIFVRDDSSTLKIANPFGNIEIGDPNGMSTSIYIYYDTGSGILYGNGSNITDFLDGSFFTLSASGLLTASAGISSAGGTFSALTRFTAGISASGGVTFGGTVASDTGYRITSNAINAQTGTTYTFLETDNGKIITFNNGSAVTVTIPTALPVGFNCTAIQLGAGQVGFTAASGVTLQSYGNQYRLIGQHASATIIEYATNIANLSGNLII